ncbi:MAG: FAD-dependent oxidoreductase [Myxococcota bacterium]|nr:FAD-dependent oxidoreductase [Myxococcota bacterium]
MAVTLRERDANDSWDQEVDVLVIGLGAAGAAAALEASSHSAKTWVAEASGAGGGTSAMSGGVIYLGGGTPLQTACGFQDSPEAMYEYLMASCGDAPDQEKIRAYCDESVDHYRWLVAQGVPFKPSYYEGTSGEPPTDDGLVWSGAERAYPFTEKARPAPRGHVPQVPHQAGPLLMKTLCAAVDASPARVETNTRAKALYRNAEGEILGAALETFGQERRIRARGGVVLTTGGFVLNDEMLERHAPLAHRCRLRVAATGDDGSGIRLGMAAGADTLHMDALSVSLPITQPWGLKRGILVNRQGQRFINEDTYYGRLGESALLHHGGQAWLIVDQEIFEQPEYMDHVAAAGESLAEVERELGLPDGSLQSTVALYNRHAAKKEDPVFQKSQEYLKPLSQPPFGAIDCTTEEALYAVFTLGGLRTDPNGHVLDPEGTSIAGLYAAGRSTSGLSVGGYSSGLSLGDGTFFGRRAGRAAALRSASSV